MPDINGTNSQTFGNKLSDFHKTANMPVYLRKNAPMSAPSAATTDFGDEDPDDFILDPEQFRDFLPQPFRMVDKVINALIDRALEIVLHREEERIREATKVRPPQYRCAVHLQVK